jgi:hypothetical protein
MCPLFYLCALQDWYTTNLGFSDEDLAAVDVKEAVTALPRSALPPYNG